MSDFRGKIFGSTAYPCDWGAPCCRREALLALCHRNAVPASKVVLLLVVLVSDLPSRFTALLPSPWPDAGFWQMVQCDCLDCLVVSGVGFKIFVFVFDFNSAIICFIYI